MAADYDMYMLPRVYKRSFQRDATDAAQSEFRDFIDKNRRDFTEAVLKRIISTVDELIDSCSESQVAEIVKVVEAIPTIFKSFSEFTTALISNECVKDSMPWLIQQLEVICTGDDSMAAKIKQIQADYSLAVNLSNAVECKIYLDIAMQDKDVSRDICATASSLGLHKIPRLRLQNFVKVHQVGQGAYGDVWLAEDIVNKKAVALKKLKLNDEREGFPKNAIREIYILNSLRHRNIVILLGIANSAPFGDAKENVWMVFEYLPFDLGGYMEALRDPNEKRDKLTRPTFWLTIGEIKHIMKQLLEAVAFCHHRNILHRDLKSANLLMTNDGTIKVADFGLARTCTNDQGNLTNRVVTLWYRPPELLLGSETYDAAVDMWSVGCIMAELVSGTHIFAADKEASILKLIAERLGLPLESDIKWLSTLPLWSEKLCNPLHPSNHGTIITKRSEIEKIFKNTNQLGNEGWDLLRRFFAWSAPARITAEEALEHPWFVQEPTPCPLIDRQNVRVAHSFMTKNQRRRDLQRNFTKRHDYNKYANTGAIRKSFEQHRNQIAQSTQATANE